MLKEAIISKIKGFPQSLEVLELSFSIKATGCLYKDLLQLNKQRKEHCLLRTKDGIGGSFAKGTWKRELMERSPRSPRLRININDIEAGLAKFLATPSFTDIDAAQLPSLDAASRRWRATGSHIAIPSADRSFRSPWTQGHKTGIRFKKTPFSMTSSFATGCGIALFLTSYRCTS
ncbi:uncharacterized protein LACBIDRAFT_330874 [Laccaria bicolor S238N-H82]|uniref:Predicted protein n=1 Tax=Laccaria bicolor (strain S238N-H82 / ATCC MYA-4686) TaxID=486041 RepID=B0DN13_LACBS|nr:uncharacterized protein LACBIDRAFT_330874 [Laccaria bicolor S238N-H82]EDR03972.1 predicted protein [Laccaria bicolor S238N-H82]|eukprot:XP_001885227.1 predicted protein [Laccaria bicolor S238N-H82]